MPDFCANLACRVEELPDLEQCEVRGNRHEELREGTRKTKTGQGQG